MRNREHEKIKIERPKMIEERQKKLLDKIVHKHIRPGYTLLVANFENECCAFQQESSFFYLTGITDPGCVVLINPDGESTLFIPRYQQSRSKWVSCQIENVDCAIEGINKVEFLGDEIPGYTLSAATKLSGYSNLLKFLKNIGNNKLFTLYPDNPDEYPLQKLFLERVFREVPTLETAVTDMSDIVAQMRRKKSAQEIEYIRTAVDITNAAHHAAATQVKDTLRESDIQNALEGVMRNAGTLPAFRSIVGSGTNSTMLHYCKNSARLKNGDVVVVDIGARFNGYCADITRTYAVGGEFSSRQKELYEIVRATQKYIADRAKPGMYLFNTNELDNSLHHLAVEFLKKQGYEKYFTHGLGHFLGLDVHDVGDRAEALAAGDVFTIEPGIYIAEEEIGIRIEDDYLMTENGVECLSAALEK